MTQHKSKFEPAVHLGLLVIIFVLLFLNFRSNLTIFHAGSEKRQSVVIKLNNAALSISRTVQKENLSELSPDKHAELTRKHGLVRLALFPVRGTDSNAWLPGEADESTGPISDKLVAELQKAPAKSLTRGQGGEYFYKYTFHDPDGTKALYVSQIAHDLAYLEDSSHTLIIVNLVAVALIVVLYLVLFRLILSPFKRIKRQAIDAGRPVTDERDEVEAMVEDYQHIIDELKEKETQLLELNQAIQAKADRLELFNQYLLRSMSSAVVMIDCDCRIVSMNKAAGVILGIESHEFIGKPLDELPACFSAVFSPVTQLLAGHPGQTYREFDVEFPGKTTLCLGVTISALQDYTSQEVGASVLINDLTEIKALRGEVETKDRLAALGEMASGLAHQLRNSLGAMAGYTHLVKTRLLKNNLELDSVTALEDEAGEAERLVERFLTFARPLNFMPENTDMIGLIEDLVETFKVRPDNAHIDFTVTDHADCGGNADVDRLLIKQALANIIENAINAYAGVPGTIRIEMTDDQGQFAVAVHDDGCGISKENLERIFTPFFSSRPSGTGLGLPLAKKIVDLHNARLVVDSEIDKGTSFTIILPKVQSALSSSEHSKLRA